MSFEPDNFCPECDEVEQTAKRIKMNRRKLVGGTAAAVGAAALAKAGVGAQDASPAASGLVDSEGNPVVIPPSYVGAQLSKIEKLSEEPVTLKVFTAATTNVSDFSSETNLFSKWYEEQTNVKVEWQVAPGLDQATTTTALTTALAGGEYGDVIMGFGLSRTQQLVYGTQGVFVPLEDHIANMPRLQSIIEAYPETNSLMTLPDGHVYSFPEVNDCYHCRTSSGRVWVYQPWLEELGLEMPTTTEEFKAMLQAFNDAGHPNALAADLNSIWNFYDWMDGAFFYPGQTGTGAVGQFLRVENGQLVETLTKEERKDALRFMNDLYTANLISDENFTRDNDQLRQISNGEETVVGVASAYYWGSFMDITDASPEARWRGYKGLPNVQGPGGYRGSIWNYYGAVNTGKFMITDKCENPELAAKWADGFYELEATLRAVQGTINSGVRWATEGETGINDEQALWTQIIPWGELDGSEYWDQRSLSYRSSEFRLGEAVDPEAPTFERDLYEAVRDSWFPYAEPQDQQPIPYALNEEQANEIALIQAPIDDYLKQARAAFTRGDADFEGGWEAYIENLNGLGLQQYIELNNAAYQTALENAAKTRTRFA